MKLDIDSKASALFLNFQNLNVPQKSQFEAIPFLKGETMNETSNTKLHFWSCRCERLQEREFHHHCGVKLLGLKYGLSKKKTTRKLEA